MSSYLDNLRKQQALHAARKPKNVGKSVLRESNKAYNVTKSHVEVKALRDYTISEDGTVNVK